MVAVKYISKSHLYCTNSFLVMMEESIHRREENLSHDLQELHPELRWYFNKSTSSWLLLIIVISITTILSTVSIEESSHKEMFLYLTPNHLAVGGDISAQGWEAFQPGSSRTRTWRVGTESTRMS